MKKYFFYSLFLLAMGLAEMKSQNVGINATGVAPDNSAGLDVNFTNKGFLPPRVALTGSTDAVTIPSPATGLMVYNTSSSGGLTPGYYYNRGTPASPYWTTLTKQLTYHSSATSGVTITTNGAVTLIPGTAITVVVPTGLTADIDIFAYAGVSLNGGTSTTWAVGDLIVYKNGAYLLGGWNRVKVNNRDGTITDMATTSIISRDAGVTAGTYTYDLRGNRFAGTYDITVGGNCSNEVDCAQMTIIVTFR